MLSEHQEEKERDVKCPKECLRRKKVNGEAKDGKCSKMRIWSRVKRKFLKI